MSRGSLTFLTLEGTGGGSGVIGMWQAFHEMKR